MAAPQKPQKIIIDTDPGCDDILALLLALAAPGSHLQTLLISLTFGNIDIQCVLRNAITLFHILDLERDWRASKGLPRGFSSLYEHPPPIIAVGADEPLEGEQLTADYFHGVDGLGGVHEALPHLGVGEQWQQILENMGEVNEDLGGEVDPRGARFRKGKERAHKEILRVLREEEEGSVVIIALGPLTNLALAAEEDLTTFLRVKEVIVMGGAIDLPGNVTPKAEFNHYACAYSAARIYALTSPHPPSMLPTPPRVSGFYIPWPPTPENPFKPLNLTILPIDVTSPHLLNSSTWNAKVSPLMALGSPLATWCDHFIQRTFEKMRDLHNPGANVDLEMHDPMTIYYLLSDHLGVKGGDDPVHEGKGKWRVWEERDIRVEAMGQWSRGMNVVETRDRVMAKLGEELILGDMDLWLHEGYGNRVRQVVESPGTKTFPKWLCDMVFG